MLNYQANSNYSRLSVWRCGQQFPQRERKWRKSMVLNSLLFSAKEGGKGIGVGTLTKLPGNINLVREFLSAVNWKTAQGEIQWALTSKIALIGLPNRSEE